ncbi:glycosyltransferase family A protein [Persephonella sp. KM09-Lau-8]|uniref:glycosyltransferase family A protein n=1 Tax=Persephonella sp. KM09-Lau-8 TaxID=1158345 RepID=UPI00068B29EC|nr:glycosyltransferase family A protein [Persephonella sp. KM09-Lau-8]
MKILVGSPIRQKPEVLRYFLEFLTYLEDFENLDFFFIDDNVEETSEKLLEDFRNKTDRVILEKSWYTQDEEYKCDNNTHHWTDNLIWKVADFKDRIIDYAREKNYDYLFFVDSDLLLYPQTIKHLISTGKDIISEVFWTKWKPTDPIEYPQVWLSDHYNLFEAKYINAPEEIQTKKNAKISKKT